MSGCTLCPRACGADRSREAGKCGARDVPRVARAMLHNWEEPCISGTRGSGAIFFSGCNLNCVFCQNYDISQTLSGTEADDTRLKSIMLSLQDAGAHNINLVTPAPHVPAILRAVRLAREQGLKIPVVYNTNAYEKAETLRALDGVVDVYLPDLKYVSARASERYSNAADYFYYASEALKEMWRQCGELVLDLEGVAVRGVLVRHLVLPGSVDETRRVLDFLSENFCAEIAVSLMCQYVPMYKADFAPLNRKLLRREYDRAVRYCIEKGFSNVLVQRFSSADRAFTPLFDKNLNEI
ncbi:MAG: radical SAM protein [Clostridiaceae bacterium]|nr:radical SAM protein [Eubacteriales bacterium]